MAAKDVHIDVPLSNVAITYRPEGFIADMIAPKVPVPKQSDGYWIFMANEAFRRDDAYRAPGTEPNRITYEQSTAKFFCDNYALADRIPYEDLEGADDGYIFAERSARAMTIKSKLYLDKEYRVANQCTSGSNVGSYSATASAWTDYTNCDGLNDIETAIGNIEDLTGFRPNSIVFGGYAWRHWRRGDKVKNELFGSAGRGDNGRQVNLDMVKTLFQLERVLVGGAYLSTAGEGQTQSLSSIWNDNVLIYYAPMQPRRDVPSFMYDFTWNKIMSLEMAAEVHQLPRAKAEEVHLGYYSDEVLTGADLAFLLTGVGSSQ